jgi:hypothetical protein
VLRRRIGPGSYYAFTSDFFGQAVGYLPIRSSLDRFGKDPEEVKTQALMLTPLAPDGASAAVACPRMVVFYGSLGNLGMSRPRHF